MTTSSDTLSYVHDTRDAESERGDVSRLNSNASTTSSTSSSSGLSEAVGNVTPIVAIECEMVGVGPGCLRSPWLGLGPVFGSQVFRARFVLQEEQAVDYRTSASEIRAQDVDGLMNRDAVSLKQVQRDVAAILSNRTLVGHSIDSDLQTLVMAHPKLLIRDTGVDIQRVRVLCIVWLCVGRV
jgi:hypothetical protein